MTVNHGAGEYVGYQCNRERIEDFEPAKRTINGDIHVSASICTNT
jgi:hypothetical protein